MLGLFGERNREKGKPVVRPGRKAMGPKSDRQAAEREPDLIELSRDHRLMRFAGTRSVGSLPAEKALTRAED